MLKSIGNLGAAVAAASALAIGLLPACATPPAAQAPSPRLAPLPPSARLGLAAGRPRPRRPGQRLREFHASCPRHRRPVRRSCRGRPGPTDRRCARAARACVRDDRLRGPGRLAGAALRGRGARRPRPWRARPPARRRSGLGAGDPRRRGGRRPGLWRALCTRRRAVRRRREGQASRLFGAAPGLVQGQGPRPRGPAQPGETDLGGGLSAGPRRRRPVADRRSPRGAGAGARRARWWPAAWRWRR